MHITAKPRKTGKSLRFEDGGITFLKNDYLSVAISEFGSTQKTKRGHFHFDIGSFTLSYKGVPVIVDPGTYTYTRNKRERDKYRREEYHNTIWVEDEDPIEFHTQGFFGGQLENKVAHFIFRPNMIKLTHNYYRDIAIRKIVIDRNTIKISDNFPGSFISILHFNPYFKNINVLDSQGISGEYNKIGFKLLCDSDYNIGEYYYSHEYGSKISAKKIDIKAVSNLLYELTFYHKN